ncbi:DUF2141 domain-containing protein [Crocinitomicaceae bacterium]|nr:DUF2141 domain-containing protein [Crocinitomicaceae bacterium]
MIKLLVYLLMAGSSNISDLNLVIKGVDDIKGSMYIAVFDNEESFPDFGKQLVEKVLPVDAKTLNFTFKNLPNDDYAVAIFHDKNNNGVLDKNAFGFPLEPYGFSRNARARFSAPAFNDAKIVLDGNQSIEITVK